MAKDELQLRFHGGKQQRYFSDRRELLECILRIGGQSPDPIFEVWRQDAPVVLADGRSGGRTYSLAEVIDLSRERSLEELASELESLRLANGASHG
jgi:hypothetical protein